MSSTLSADLKVNPSLLYAREQVAHYVWGVTKYASEQCLKHLTAIEKNPGDVAAITQFVTDYNQA